MGDDTTSNGRSVSVDRSAFEAWYPTAEQHLRVALVATLGAEVGREAAAEALSYAWEHCERVLAMENSVGYLFRVGKRWGVRHQGRQRRRFGLTPPSQRSPEFEPALEAALASLSTRQRQAIVLCVGYGLSHAEAAELLHLKRSSMQNHLERGMDKLRKELGT